MNQIAIGGLRSVAQVRRPTRRALAKQRTREKIAAAARTLFTERGYDGATIRDIATAAGMSTGAVFANFTDKSDLFAEIVVAERQALVQVMGDAAAAKPPLEAIQAMFEAAAERHLGDLALFRATMSAIWSTGLGELVRNRFARAAVGDVLGPCLRAGVDCGLLRGSTDLTLVADMLWDCYVSAIRRAALEGAGGEAVKRRLRDEIQIVLAGARQAQGQLSGP
ncbi:MAG TPA: TetR/AcrR family transcriptional regulator [Caulobacteraceae bacterium]|nr:TetR/AcrR family transcriptional regulator [Caulobacteraceae bacterium]